MTRRNLYFLLATLIATGLYWTPLKTLATFSFHSNVYPYAGVIPLLSACLIYLEKERIFSLVHYDLGIGLILLFLALVIRWCNMKYSGGLSPNDSLSLVTLSFIVLWIGVFVLCYGTKTLQAAAFQLSLLLLMAPLPQALVERSILVLQGCSTQAAGILFRLGGVPVFQNGFRFSLPGLDVEVAEQCSGIRSGLSLFITSLLMGRIFLRSPWRRLWLVLAVFPVTIFKSGLRIVTIYWLTVHPSMGSLVVWVHRYGGIPFSILGLSLLAFLVISLRRFEETSTGSWWIISGGARVREKAADRALDLTC
jgi:exosortase